uniref:Uncharacterized protein n=1 Tax=Anopheles dirus TaxID=7168 RepID=A0A182NXD2_9DIPT
MSRCLAANCQQRAVVVSQSKALIRSALLPEQ